MYASFAVIIDSFPYLIQGAFITAGIVVCAMLFGLVLGVCIAIGIIYGPRPLRYLLNLYLWIFRGVPVLVLLFLFYFGLLTYLGLNLSAFASVAIVLGLTTAAYQANIFKGAILSLPR